MIFREDCKKCKFGKIGKKGLLYFYVLGALVENRPVVLKGIATWLPKGDIFKFEEEICSKEELGWKMDKKEVI